jgi:hypothetical protein
MVKGSLRGAWDPGKKNWRPRSASGFYNIFVRSIFRVFRLVPDGSKNFSNPDAAGGVRNESR